MISHHSGVNVEESESALRSWPWPFLAPPKCQALFSGKIIKCYHYCPSYANPTGQ